MDGGDRLSETKATRLRCLSGSGFPGCTFPPESLRERGTLPAPNERGLT
jgi:hypothetical protein